MSLASSSSGSLSSVKVRHLSVLYDRNPVLWDIDFSLPQGELIGIIGPNGAGKSTLLKSLMGLVKGHSGELKILGHPLESVRNRLSYLPQRESVDWDFPISVWDVVMMGRYGKMGLLKRPKKVDRDKVEKYLGLVGLSDYSDRQIGRLSGGQQQRVFLARSLVQEADLYFMDEPFSGIDAQTERLIFEILKKLRSEGKTVVIVFHNLQTVSQHFPWIVLLNKRLIAYGRTEDVFTEANLRETYGGELSIFSDLRNKLRHQDLPNRYLFSS
ncbi:MAG: metal ABC transporter ATP-binding protein [Cytophagales bacterium]|nr:metal ABC transporter ATP-binding protein [Cytophagales bacterium]